MISGRSPSLAARSIGFLAAVVVVEHSQRRGPRLPLTVGPLLLASGMALMVRIDPGDGYVGSVTPAVFVFGLGLAATSRR